MTVDMIVGTVAHGTVATRAGVVTRVGAVTGVGAVIRAGAGAITLDTTVAAPS